ncbi:hypothetical protein J7438_27105, partial [Thalassotalea sp. G20_0]|uniref:hypothetical protein n=1 Tax=Thalassotalea sp. G20_0 TaxID=2821093 RepID=UPI001ADC2EFB
EIEQASNYPYVYSDYLNDLNNGTGSCGASRCETNRRVLKMPVAPTCGVNDLSRKQFACFFMLEPARVFLDDVDEESGLFNIDLEYRTEFLAQHIPCPASTLSDKVTGAFDVVLYSGVGQ